MIRPSQLFLSLSSLSLAISECRSLKSGVVVSPFSATGRSGVLIFKSLVRDGDISFPVSRKEEEEKKSNKREKKKRRKKERYFYGRWPLPLQEVSFLDLLTRHQYGSFHDVTACGAHIDSYAFSWGISFFILWLFSLRRGPETRKNLTL